MPEFHFMPKGLPTVTQLWNGEVSFFSIDTDLIQSAGYNFDAGALNQLPKQLPATMSLQLTEIVSEEIVRHRMQPVQKAIEGFTTASENLKRLANLPLGQIDQSFAVLDAAKSAASHFRSQVQAYAGRCRGGVLSVSGEALASEIFNLYFQDCAPFAKRKDKKSELLGVSYTKYPSLSNVNTVQPNLASIVDDLAHHHNELGISLNFSNFELEVDEDVPYTTKKIIENINKILQQKRNGKLVKPEINKINTIPDTFEYWQQDMNEDGGIDRFRIQVYKKNDKWFEEFFDTYGQSESVREITYNEVEDQFNEALASNSTLTRNKGIQPKITKETLKESIESVKRQNTSIKENQWAVEPYAEEEYAVYTYMGEFVEGQPTFKSLEEANRWLKINQPKEKEYSEQALINTKIARLKEVAKKYPRSLIRSEVVRQIDTASYTGIGNDLFDEEDMPFQKIPSIATKQEENPSETLNLAEQKNHCKL